MSDRAARGRSEDRTVQRATSDRSGTHGSTDVAKITHADQLPPVAETQDHVALFRCSWRHRLCHNRQAQRLHHNCAVEPSSCLKWSGRSPTCTGGAALRRSRLVAFITADHNNWLSNGPGPPSFRFFGDGLRSDEGATRFRCRGSTLLPTTTWLTCRLPVLVLSRRLPAIPRCLSAVPYPGLVPRDRLTQLGSGADRHRILGNPTIHVDISAHGAEIRTCFMFGSPLFPVR